MLERLPEASHATLAALAQENWCCSHVWRLCMVVAVFAREPTTGSLVWLKADSMGAQASNLRSCVFLRKRDSRP